MNIKIIDSNKRISKLLTDILQINGYSAQIIKELDDQLDEKTVYICSYRYAKNHSHILQLGQNYKNLLFVIEDWENVPVEIIPQTLEISYPLNLHLILHQIDQAINKLQQTNHFKTILIGNSRFTTELRKKLEIISKTDATVLITGESGTGKDVVSQLIHANSTRRNNKLVKINCASIPNGLLESEMFGYKKGAFTNATKDNDGKLIYASNGTLFLDEVGELSLELQAKFLRVLEENVVIPVGGNEPKPIDIRFIFATNKNIKEEVALKRFREDLYYRINTIELHLIPLRNRKEDIPYLVDHFISQYNKKYNKTLKGLHINDILKLYHYDWPGNIRELQHFVERLVIYSNGTTYPDVQNLLNGFDDYAKTNVSFYKEAMMNYETFLITSYLLKNKWNIVKTAKEMGIERTNLYKKMKRLRIEVHKKQSPNKEQ